MRGAESDGEVRTPKVLALLSEGHCPACEGRLTAEGEHPRIQLLCRACGVYWYLRGLGLQCVIRVEHEGQRHSAQRINPIDWWEEPGFPTWVVDQLQRWRDSRLQL